MKTIGLIGGMSWESSIEYYRIINETVREKLGGLHSARNVMYSVDFADIETLQHQNRWEEATQLMIEAAQHVQNGGADFVLICTNTMHKMAEDVQKNLNIPLIHIADATAQAIKNKGLTRIGLLGTRFTMEEQFYRGRLESKYGLTVLLPDEDDREIIHRIIYDELCLGEVEPSSKEVYIAIINKLIQKGAQGIILGCTEISLLVGESDCSAPIFDTTLIHAVSAVEYALSP